MRLCQIAISVTDLRRTQRWYREVLGLEPAGGTNLFAGPLASMVQGVPRAASTCWWLVDRQDCFQIELFEFRSPLVRPLPADWRPCDIGYTMVSVRGRRPRPGDGARRRRPARRRSPSPLGEPGARRVCVRDPDGVLIELMEDDPRAARAARAPAAGLDAAARSVTLSVPDLERSRRLFVDVLGLEVAEGSGSTGPSTRRSGASRAHSASRSRCGRTTCSSSWSSTRIRRAGRGRPATGSRTRACSTSPSGFGERAEFEAAHARCLEAGLRRNGPPLRLGAWSVVYVNDDQGFSVELLHVEPWYERQMGFRPRPTPRLAPLAGRTPARLRAERRLREGAGHRRRRGPRHGALPLARRGRHLAGRCSTATATGSASSAGGAGGRGGGGGARARLRRPRRRGRGRRGAGRRASRHRPADRRRRARPRPVPAGASTGARRATTSRSTRCPTWCCCRTWRRRWRGAAAGT